MLPNLRLSGTNNSPIDSLDDILGVSAAAAVRSAADSTNLSAKLAANRLAAAAAAAASSQNASTASGWGVPVSNASDFANNAKIIAEYMRNSMAQRGPQSLKPSMPWAAAVKAPSDAQHAPSSAAGTAYDCSSTIGSWSSPETSSSNRGGWNADGSSKSDVFDDGTAIWGNPTTKKTGIDWTERESLLNPPQASNHSEKRIQKPEPTVSSLHGTEAWGVPAGGSSIKSININNSQQQSKLNDNSGNNNDFGSKVVSEQPSWGESSSLHATATTKNEYSSPPNSSVWNNNLAPSANSNNGGNGNRQRSSDWLSSSSSSTSVTGSRVDELNKQLETASIFDTVSSSPPSSSKSKTSTASSSSNNPNLDNQQSSIGLGMSGNSGGHGTIGGGLGGGNVITDLKQMSANFTDDLLDSPQRQSSNNNSMSASNNPQSQLNPNAAYPLGVTPSRDLLKQMVHQIQLAVQAGHLNAHILNQPMSTPTLQLVYTLLQQIKLLQQFQEIQQRAGVKMGDSGSPTNLDPQIHRVQQNIALLQKAITQQQAALTKNETLVDSNLKQQQQQQAANNNYSYATISKLSTNQKVPPNNMSNMINNSNIDSFRRSSLIDTLSNSNSDSLRSAQATFDANATIDKTLSPLLQASASGNNILNKAQCFTSGNNVNHHQQAPKSGLSSAQASSPPPSSSSSSAAWMAFNSNDSVSQGWPTNRISANVSQQGQQQHFNSELMSEFGNGARPWRGSSILSPDGKENPSNSMAPGANINLARPNSASNNLKQISENDILSNKDPSLFYDWSNNISDSTSKRNFDASGFSSSAIGGLSLQSNPWSFAPTSSSSLNIGGGVVNLMSKGNTGSGGNIGNKLDNGNMDKMACDPLSFLGSNSGNIQRSSSALYDWSELASSTMQFNADSNSIDSNRQGLSVGGGGSSGPSNSSSSRPAPPPGLMSNFGSASVANGVSSMDNANKFSIAGDEAQMRSRDSASSLWSGAWFD